MVSDLKIEGCEERGPERKLVLNNTPPRSIKPKYYHFLPDGIRPSAFCKDLPEPEDLAFIKRHDPSTSGYRYYHPESKQEHCMPIEKPHVINEYDTLAAI